MKRKCRIIERTNVNGEKVYVIQHKHFLFKWYWIDGYQYPQHNTHHTLEEAKKNICYFDGTKVKETILLNN